VQVRLKPPGGVISSKGHYVEMPHAFRPRSSTLRIRTTGCAAWRPVNIGRKLGSNRYMYGLAVYQALTGVDQ
jgi:hypothetical protein